MEAEYLLQIYQSNLLDKQKRESIFTFLKRREAASKARRRIKQFLQCRDEYVDSWLYFLLNFRASNHFARFLSLFGLTEETINLFYRDILGGGGRKSAAAARGGGSGGFSKSFYARNKKTVWWLVASMLFITLLAVGGAAGKAELVVKTGELVRDGIMQSVLDLKDGWKMTTTWDMVKTACSSVFNIMAFGGAMIVRPLRAVGWMMVRNATLIDFSRVSVDGIGAFYSIFRGYVTNMTEALFYFVQEMSKIPVIEIAGNMYSNTIIDLTEKVAVFYKVADDSAAVRGIAELLGAASALLGAVAGVTIPTLMMYMFRAKCIGGASKEDKDRSIVEARETAEILKRALDAPAVPPLPVVAPSSGSNSFYSTQVDPKELKKIVEAADEEEDARQVLVEMPPETVHVVVEAILETTVPSPSHGPFSVKEPVQPVRFPKTRHSRNLLNVAKKEAQLQEEHRQQIVLNRLALRRDNHR